MKHVFSVILRTAIILVAIGCALRLNFQMGAEKETITVLLPYEGKYGAPIIADDNIALNMSGHSFDYGEFKDGVFSKLVVFHAGRNLQFLGIVEHSDDGFLEESVRVSAIPMGEWWQLITRVEHGLFSHPDMGLPFGGDVPEPCVVVTLGGNFVLCRILGVMFVVAGILFARIIKVSFGA